MSFENKKSAAVITAVKGKLGAASAWSRLPASYLTFLGGLLVSRLGDALYTFAMPWISYQLTHSALVMSSMFAIEVLPVILFGPVTGAVVDAWDRRRLMLAADAGRAVLVACVPILELFGQLHIWHLYAAGFLLAALSLLFEVANTASVPVLAGAELTRANASAQFITQATALIGPAAAGAVVAAFGGYAALWLDAASFGATWLAVRRLPYLGGGQGAVRIGRILRDMKSGLLWLARNRLNLALSLQAMVGNFGYSAVSSVLMYYLLSELHQTAQEASINFSLAGVGGIAGSFLIVPLAGRIRHGKLICVLLAVGAAGFAVPVVSQIWFFPGLALAIVGICNVGWNTLVQSMRQMTVPPDMLGRVLGFSRVATRLAMPIGAAVGGLMMEHASPAAIFAVAGAAKALEFIIALLSPIRRM